MTQIEHESASRRRHYRLTAPINIEYKNKLYKTIDWSIGGFRVGEFTTELEAGAKIEVIIRIPFQKFVISAPQKARVIRFNAEEKSLACEFIESDERTNEMLKYFSRSLISGEMASIDNVIKRIDIPVTPPQELEKTAWRDQPLSVKTKRIMMLLFYALLGVAVVSYTVMALYSYFFRLQAETGVISIPRESITAPISGTIKEILVRRNERFQKGQPLLVIEEAKMRRIIDQTRMEAKKATHKLKLQQGLLDALNKKITVYEKITSSRIKALTQKVGGLKKEVELARNEFDRQHKLAERNAVSASQAEVAESRYTRLKKELEVTVEELNIQTQTMMALKKGYFFSGRKIEEDRNELVNKVNLAKLELKSKEEELEYVQETFKPIRITAPFDGKVLKIEKSAGNLIEKGKTLVHLQKNYPVTIKVFMTQQEVTKLSLHSMATVYIPSHEERYLATVVGIDRAAGFLNVAEMNYRWRNKHDRSAVVTLAFSHVKPDILRREFKAGLPVVVNFKVLSRNRVISWLQHNLINE